MYDITNYSSFEDIEDWLSTVKKLLDKSGGTYPHFGLVGNKGKHTILFTCVDTAVDSVGITNVHSS